MRAARYYGAGDVRIESVEEPPVPTNGVRIDIDGCGICGTDVTEYKSGPVAVPNDSPHPVTGETLPITLGHEFSGRIVEVGPAVENVAEGDSVVVNPIVPCRECEYCLYGEYRLCERFANVGLHGNGGGFAERTVVPASNVIRLPESFPIELGPLVEPLSVSLHAVRQSDISAGDRVAVFGAGPIGLGVVQAARAAGAREVFVSEPRVGRRELAGELGADGLIDPTTDNPVSTLRDETGIGVDIAFEAAGIEASVTGAIRSTKKGGKIISIAAAEDIPFQPNDDFVMTERAFEGSFAYNCVPFSERGEFGTVIRMLTDGRLNGEAMVTDRIGLSELVEKGLEPLANGAKDQVKILVESKN